MVMDLQFGKLSQGDLILTFYLNLMSGCLIESASLDGNLQMKGKSLFGWISGEIVWRHELMLTVF